MRAANGILMMTPNAYLNCVLGSGRFSWIASIDARQKITPIVGKIVMAEDKRSNVARRAGKDRRNGVDTRSTQEKADVTERRSGNERRTVFDRRTGKRAGEAVKPHRGS